MADGIRTETLRQEQLKFQIERQNELEMKKTRSKYKNDLERTVAQNVATKDDLEKAYEVALSQQKEEFAQRIEDVRNNNAKLLQEARSQGEEELGKTRTRYQEQIARYREQSEKTIDETRKQTEAAVANLKTRAARPAAQIS